MFERFSVNWHALISPVLLKWLSKCEMSHTEKVSENGKAHVSVTLSERLHQKCLLKHSQKYPVANLLCIGFKKPVEVITKQTRSVRRNETKCCCCFIWLSESLQSTINNRKTTWSIGMTRCKLKKCELYKEYICLHKTYIEILNRRTLI